MWNVYSYAGNLLMMEDCGSEEQAWKFVRLFDAVDDYQFYHYAKYVETENV